MAEKKKHGGEFAPGGGHRPAEGGGEKKGGQGGGGQEKSERAARAKAAHVMVGRAEQRYAEGNEPIVAQALGGEAFKGNGPADIVISENGAPKHGIELKTITQGKNAKITMKGDALARKRTWARRNKAAFHTVVLDDSAVFNALGAGQHDQSKRRIFYRRGAGSFRVQKMYLCSSFDELKRLIFTPTKKLPEGAK